MRKAFRMSVHPDAHAEYERRHRPIWPELEQTLITHGVTSYSIFMDEERSELFGYVEIEDDARWAAVARTEICQRWWQHMRDIMPANADNSPVSRELREVFYINSGAKMPPENDR
ncbi:MAG: L-rhamnose mutarotase [Vicinamibacterales bacterium]